MENTGNRRIQEMLKEAIDKAKESGLGIDHEVDMVIWKNGIKRGSDTAQALNWAKKQWKVGELPEVMYKVGDKEFDFSHSSNAYYAMINADEDTSLKVWDWLRKAYVGCNRSEFVNVCFAIDPIYIPSLLGIPVSI